MSATSDIPFSIFVILLLITQCFALNLPQDETEQLRNLLNSEREAKQFGFFQWLFGPPVNKSRSSNLDENRISHHSTTIGPFIYHQLHHYKDSFGESVKSNQSEPKDRVAAESYNPQRNYTNLVTNSSKVSSFDIDFPHHSQTIRPKPRNARRESDSGGIQIAEIQHSFGTEINDADLNLEPSQVKTIDGFQKNLTGRVKRDSKFRQLSIPYGSSTSASNNRINTLSKRQLLLSPAEQQMFALRQQQDLAAATMLQQQQLLNYNRYGGGYNNRYFDDYYDDDDSSYEDSDEYYEYIRRYGMRNPLAEAMRNGVFIPPNHPLGIGRRSLPDNPPPPSTKQGRNKWPKNKESLLGPISKTGRWDATIEDYDLSSDFNRQNGRYGIGRIDSASHKEMDEEFEEKMGKERSGLPVLAKQATINNITDEPVPQITEPIQLSSSESTQAPEIIVTTIAPQTEPPVEISETTPISSSEEEEGVTDIISATTSVQEVSVSPEESSEVSSEMPISGVSSNPVSTTSLPTTTSTKPAKLPPYMQTLDCRCGTQTVRGHDIEDNTVLRTTINPWLVSVRTRGNKHLCSGSIVNNKYVLTSKSCVQGMKRGLMITAGLGSGTARNFTVIHTNHHTSKNIALLKVKPAISPNHAMRPICLPIRPRESPNQGTGILVTFKKSSVKSKQGLELVQTEVPMLSSSKCSKAAGYSATSGNICHAPPGSLKCGGDSGGILQVYQKGYSYEQIAVVSTTVGCRAKKTAGVYTDIRTSVKWILYNTKDARYCKKPKIAPKDLINTSRINAAESNAEEDLNEDWNDDDNLPEEEQEDEEWDLRISEEID